MPDTQRTRTPHERADRFDRVLLRVYDALLLVGAVTIALVAALALAVPAVMLLAALS